MIRVHGGYDCELTYITYLGVETLEVQNGKTIRSAGHTTKKSEKPIRNIGKK